MRKVLFMLAVSGAALAAGSRMSGAEAMPATAISAAPVVAAAQPTVQPVQYWRRHYRRCYWRYHRRYCY